MTNICTGCGRKYTDEQLDLLGDHVLANGLCIYQCPACPVAPSDDARLITLRRNVDLFQDKPDAWVQYFTEVMRENN